MLTLLFWSAGDILILKGTAAKAVDKHQSHLCVLASCDACVSTKLVEALCAENQIGLINTDDNKSLGKE